MIETASPRGVRIGAVTLVPGTGRASDRGRIVGRRVPSGRRRVVLLDILLYHPPSGKAGSGKSDRAAHFLHPAQWDAVGVPIVVERDDLLFQQSVEPLGVGSI